MKSKYDTLPETNMSHPNMDGWNTSFLLGWAYFQGQAVIFREGPRRSSNLKCPNSFCFYPCIFSKLESFVFSPLTLGTPGGKDSHFLRRPITWMIITVSKWLGSPPYISHEKAIWKGNNFIRLGNLQIMVINHILTGMILQALCETPRRFIQTERFKDGRSCDGRWLDDSFQDVVLTAAPAEGWKKS